MIGGEYWFYIGWKIYLKTDFSGLMNWIVTLHFFPVDVLMTLSGKTPHLYRHELPLLHSQAGRLGNRFPLDRLLVPRRLSPSQRVPETRNCLRACVGKNPYNGYRYLCAATPNGIFLMQWYDPLNKFMLLKVNFIIIPFIHQLLAAYYSWIFFRIIFHFWKFLKDAFLVSWDSSGIIRGFNIL